MTAEWWDEGQPSLAITGPLYRDVMVSLDVAALCGSELSRWSVEEVDLPAGQTATVVIPWVSELQEMQWSDYGVQLSVRLRILDAQTGEVLDFGHAPSRWVWFTDGQFLLTTPEESVELLAAEAPEEGEVLVAVMPPDAVRTEVP